MTDSEIKTVVTSVVEYLRDEARAMDQRTKARERKALHQVSYRIEKSMGWAEDAPHPQARPPILTYVVVGLYHDNLQRFAEDVQARTPEEAESLFSADHPDVTIAGIVSGVGIRVVDSQS